MRPRSAKPGPTWPRPIARYQDRNDPIASRIGDIDHVGIVLVVGEVFEPDELEDVVLIGPVLQGGLGSLTGGSLGDVLRHGDEPAREVIARLKVQVVVGTVERVVTIDPTLAVMGHLEGIKDAFVVEQAFLSFDDVHVELSRGPVEGVIGGQ
jgi:hypothetical protein